MHDVHCQRASFNHRPTCRDEMGHHIRPLHVAMKAEAPLPPKLGVQLSIPNSLTSNLHNVGFYMVVVAT